MPKSQVSTLVEGYYIVVYIRRKQDYKPHGSNFKFHVFDNHHATDLIIYISLLIYIYIQYPTSSILFSAPEDYSLSIFSHEGKHTHAKFMAPFKCF